MNESCLANAAYCGSDAWDERCYDFWMSETTGGGSSTTGDESDPPTGGESDPPTGGDDTPTTGGDSDPAAGDDDVDPWLPTIEFCE